MSKLRMDIKKLTVERMKDDCPVEIGCLEITLEGRLDTTTAPQLEQVLDEQLKDVKEVILNLDKLDYLSSAGLRVILTSHKYMQDQKEGNMIVRHVNDEVMEVFSITGFTDILNIED